RLHFNDPQYGFIAPVAKFLTVGYDKQGNVWSVTLSPQIETLPLDDAMAIFIDLQDQLLRGGWRRTRTAENPPIADTPAIRAQIRDRSDPITYWIADNKYEIILDIRRVVHENHPNDERYLITLRLSGPPLMTDSPGG
ncbi:flagellar biosynthesis sigma factor, partial [Caballeronia sp.]|uniref:flagellar biosynthesis sigma factor n=1 Tax=Caballeronia sp. TaxID=1931223 RepID=UPI003C4DE084